MPFHYFLYKVHAMPSRSVQCCFVLIILCITVFSCYGPDNVKPDNVKEADSKKFDVIEFGGNNWLVLEIKDGMALLFSEKIIERRQYHSKNIDVTWSKSDIRKYLNGDFLKKFSKDDRERISDTKVLTCSPAGCKKETIDKIFLLSSDELSQYFSDSGHTPHVIRDNICNYSSVALIAYNNNKDNSYWWIRTSGEFEYMAAYIWEICDDISVSGTYRRTKGITDNNVGVRPALWLKLPHD